MRNSRIAQGRIWVTAQIVFLGIWTVLLLAISRIHIPYLLPIVPVFIGFILIALGLVFTLLGTVTLGRSLTPTPVPKKRSSLKTSGIYSLIRHPIYSGILMIVWGLTCLSPSLPIFFAPLLLTVFFTFKSYYEEERLREVFPDYRYYEGTTRRFLPFLW